jgi:hypothetical protein
MIQSGMVFAKANNRMPKNKVKERGKIMNGS